MFCLQEPEAFTEEYEDFKTVEEMLQEEKIIEAAWEDYRVEKAQEKPKYARIARKWVGDLRRIFWNGHFRLEAQAILEELEMMATVPLTDLDGNYAEENGQYQDVDYVHQEPQTREKQLEQDFQEVLNEMAQYEDGDDPLIANFCKLIEEANSEPDLDPRPTAKIIIVPDNEYDEIELASMASEGPYMELDDDEDIWYEDRGITSVPIIQENEQMLKGKDLSSLREEMYPFTSAIRAYAQERAKYWKEQQKDFVKFLSIEGSHPSNPGETNWIVMDWIDRVPQSSRSLDLIKKKTLERLLDGAEDNLLGQNYMIKIGRKTIYLWLKRMLDDVAASKEVANFVSQMIYLSPMSAPEDLAYIFLGVSNLLPTSSRNAIKGDVIASQIPAAGYDNLADFITEWEDDLLDHALEMDGSLYYTSPDIEKICQKFENEILSTYEDSLDAKTAQERAKSQAFFRGVLAATADYQADITEAGHESWRHARSPLGALAYHKVLKLTKDFKQAWRAFWNAGKIKKISKDGVTVMADATGKEQFCQYPLAVWKLKRGEIILNDEEKKFLAERLKARKWGKPLLRLL